MDRVRQAPAPTEAHQSKGPKGAQHSRTSPFTNILLVSYCNRVTGVISSRLILIGWLGGYRSKQFLRRGVSGHRQFSLVLLTLP